MIVKVHMLAFQDDDRLRPVDIPDEIAKGLNAAGLLEAVFQRGQNDFQPVHNCCSVSVGDVAVIDDEFWVCAPAGWKHLTAAEFVAYKQLPQHERSFSQYVQSD